MEAWSGAFPLVWQRGKQDFAGIPGGPKISPQDFLDVSDIVSILE
jgi:hypothetical protein